LSNNAARLLTSLVLTAIIGAFFTIARPAEVRAADLKSIYYTASELEELKALTTAPDHSAIWKNIKSWADTHINDSPPEQEVSTNWYWWIIDADKIRRYVDTMSFMYAMTGDTVYADAGVNWLVSLSRWTKWGPPLEHGYGWSQARMIRAVAYGYSVLKDYMPAGARGTVEKTMRDNINLLTGYLNSYWNITSTSKIYGAFANHWGTVAFAAGLGALSLGSTEGSYNQWMSLVTHCVDEYLNRCGDDGTQYEAVNYTVSTMSFLMPFLEAYARVDGGTDYFAKYDSFLRNHAYLYIYLHYNLLGKDAWIPLGDDEPVLGINVDQPECNPLDDVVYPLAGRFNDGYIQQYADTYCSQDLVTSYIWKSPDVKSLPLSSLPKTRTFTDYGIVVMRENWKMDCLVAVFKSGVSGSHAHPDQNGFTILNKGALVTGNQGYMSGIESETRMNNCILVNDSVTRGAGPYSSTGGQSQEPGDFNDSFYVPFGTVGKIEAVDTGHSYYQYVRGNAKDVYNGHSATGYGYTEVYSGKEGGEVHVTLGDKEIHDTQTAGILKKDLRHFVFMEDPDYFVVFDQVEAPSSAVFTFAMNGATLALDDNIVTIGTDEMKSVILEPGSFQSYITHYIIDKGWIQHDYSVLRFRPASNSNEARFLTVHFPGSIMLPVTKIDTGNVMGAVVTTGNGTGLDLILFSKDGNRVDQYLDLSGNWVAADGNSYTFDGNKVRVQFDTYQVMRLENQTMSPVLNNIGSKVVYEGQTLQFVVSGQSPGGKPLAYSASNLPAGASFDPETQVFSWTPTKGQAGTYAGVHFEVSDGFLKDSKDIAITVSPERRPPVLNTIGNKSVVEGKPIQFTVSATDPDGAPLIYSAANLPPGAEFNSSTQVFSWTPTRGQAGTYAGVRFEVSNGSLTDVEDITITVKAVTVNSRWWLWLVAGLVIAGGLAAANFIRSRKRRKGQAASG
jgi:hypothetical protein